MAKKIDITRPNRDPDHYSKRGVPYWWAPEWIRGNSADVIHDKPVTYADASVNIIATEDGRYCAPAKTYGKTVVVKEMGTVNLYRVGPEGKLSFIQGSIQREFKSWHEDRSIDYMLLGLDPDDIIKE